MYTFVHAINVLIYIATTRTHSILKTPNRHEKTNCQLLTMQPRSIEPDYVITNINKTASHRTKSRVRGALQVHVHIHYLPSNPEKK